MRRAEPCASGDASRVRDAGAATARADIGCGTGSAEVQGGRHLRHERTTRHLVAALGLENQHTLGDSVTSSEHLRFDEQVAVITGAGGGLGKQYAVLLASRGARIVVNDTGGSVTGDSSKKSATRATTRCPADQPTRCARSSQPSWPSRPASRICALHSAFEYAFIQAPQLRARAVKCPYWSILMVTEN